MNYEPGLESYELSSPREENHTIIRTVASATNGMITVIGDDQHEPHRATGPLVGWSSKLVSLFSRASRGPLMKSTDKTPRNLRHGFYFQK